VCPVRVRFRFGSGVLWLCRCTWDCSARVQAQLGVCAGSGCHNVTRPLAIASLKAGVKVEKYSPGPRHDGNRISTCDKTNYLIIELKDSVG
jgi:hypothetical protein